MIRRHLVIAAAALFLGAGLTIAQDKPDAQGEKKQDEESERNNRRFNGMTQGILDFLARELDLDETQKEGVNKILRDSLREMFSSMQGSWGRDPDSEGMQKQRKRFENLRVEISKKISKLLTPAQRKEYEVLVEQFDRRSQRFEQSRRAWKSPAELFNPAPPSKQLTLAKAERSLFLGPKETAVIMPFVKRVVDLRWAVYESRKTRRKDLQNAVSGGATKKEISDRLANIRSAEQFQQLELIAAQQAIRELLTLQQEVRFVAMGILE